MDNELTEIITKKNWDEIVENNSRCKSLGRSQPINIACNSIINRQQQRLCLARGLAIEPEIILGDEPPQHWIPFLHNI
jgi:phosphate transport system ATP-binding protein